jgi:hypothetical protein
MRSNSAAQSSRRRPLSLVAVESQYELERADRPHEIDDCVRAIHQGQRRRYDDHYEEGCFACEGVTGFVLEVLAADVEKRRRRRPGAMTVVTAQRNRMVIVIGDWKTRCLRSAHFLAPVAVNCIQCWFHILNFVSFL